MLYSLDALECDRGVLNPRPPDHPLEMSRCIVQSNGHDRSHSPWTDAAIGGFEPTNSKILTMHGFDPADGRYEGTVIIPLCKRSFLGDIDQS